MNPDRVDQSQTGGPDKNLARNLEIETRTEHYKKPFSTIQKVPTWLSVLMLYLISTMNLGNYYCFDIPQALQTPLREKFGYVTEDVQQLYTVYSIPNFFLPFFGGILVSKIGDKLSVLLFTLFIYVGVVVSFLGLWTEQYSLLVIGRVIFGLGGENLISAQMVCAEKWFKGRYLAIAMGLNMVFCYVGSLLNNFFTPFIESRTENPFHTSVIVLMILSFSTTSAYLYIVFSLKYEHLLDEGSEDYLGLQTPNRNSFAQEVQAPKEESGFKLKDLLLLPINFWIICGGAVTTTCAYFSFTNLATDYFEFTYSLKYEEAKNYSAGISMSVIVFLLIFSNLTVKIGAKGFLLLGASFLSVVCYGTVYILSMTVGPVRSLAIVPVIGIGLWFGMYQAAYWPGISGVVDDAVQKRRKKLGLKGPASSESTLSGVAFGITNAINNIGLGLWPLLFGWINTPPSQESYQTTTLFLTLIGFLGLCFLGTLCFRDFCGDKVLHNLETSPSRVNSHKGSITHLDIDSNLLDALNEDTDTQL